MAVLGYLVVSLALFDSMENVRDRWLGVPAASLEYREDMGGPVSLVASLEQEEQ